MKSIESSEQFQKLPCLVIATRNPAKTNYYSSICHDLADQVIDLSHFSFDQKPDESGSTAQENAILKAQFYYQLTSLPVLCEDEALFVDFLPPDQQPGVHVRRIDKKNEASDEELINFWQTKIKNMHPDQLTAYWEITYCLALSPTRLHTFTKKYPRRFVYPSSKIKIKGWPLASLMGPLEFNKPFTELSPQETKYLDNQTKSIINSFVKKSLSSYQY